GLDALPVDEEGLVEARPDGEDPVVGVARVDLRAGREIDVALLVRAVGPEPELRLEEADALRERRAGARDVEPGRALARVRSGARSGAAAAGAASRATTTDAVGAGPRGRVDARPDERDQHERRPDDALHGGVFVPTPQFETSTFTQYEASLAAASAVAS